MSSPYLSSLSLPSGDSLSSALANSTTSYLLNRLDNLFFRPGSLAPSNCRSATGFVGRQATFFAGQLVLGLLELVWELIKLGGWVVWRRWVGLGLAGAVGVFMAWCCVTLAQQYSVDCQSAFLSVFPTSNPVSYVCGTKLGGHFTIGMDWFWKGKFEKYVKHGADLIAIRSFFTAKPEFVVAGADAIHQISMNREVFTKPTFMYKVLNFFGKNVVTSEGPEWKQHKRIVAPSFKGAAYPLVWSRTASIIDDMMSHENWTNHKSGDRCVINHVHNLTSKVALGVIAQAGFGLDMGWVDQVDGKSTGESPLKQKADHKRSLRAWGGWTYNKAGMSVQQSLRIVATNSILRMVMPKVLFWFPLVKLWAVDRAFTTLEKHLREIVAKRQRLIRLDMDFDEVVVDDGFEDSHIERVQRTDLFGALIRSALDYSKEVECKLTIREVIGNLYIFLLAGHETTANSLAFTFALLSLNPDAQQKMYEEVVRICGDRAPTFDDFPKLRYVLACYNESVRLFPPVNIIPKVANVDTTIPYHDLVADERRVQSVPKGSKIMLDVVGLHYNPRHWAEPEVFRPERFMREGGEERLKGFFPFSGGPRGCIGRKFTEVESVCAMATFVQKYKFLPGTQTGESLEALKKQMLEAKQVITLTVVDCPVTFERR